MVRDVRLSVGAAPIAQAVAMAARLSMRCEDAAARLRVATASAMTPSSSTTAIVRAGMAPTVGGRCATRARVVWRFCAARCARCLPEKCLAARLFADRRLDRPRHHPPAAWVQVDGVVGEVSSSRRRLPVGQNHVASAPAEAAQTFVYVREVPRVLAELTARAERHRAPGGLAKGDPHDLACAQGVERAQEPPRLAVKARRPIRVTVAPA